MQRVMTRIPSSKDLEPDQLGHRIRNLRTPADPSSHRQPFRSCHPAHPGRSRLTVVGEPFYALLLAFQKLRLFRRLVQLHCRVEPQLLDFVKGLYLPLFKFTPHLSIQLKLVTSTRVPTLAMLIEYGRRACGPLNDFCFFRACKFCRYEVDILLVPKFRVL